MRQPFRSLSQQSNRQLFGRAFYVVEALERRYLLSTISVIDVLVVYTPAALSAAGSFSALDFRVQRSIDETNMAMANSLINASLRLVGEVEVNYTETGVLQTDLNNIQAGGASTGVPVVVSVAAPNLASIAAAAGAGGALSSAAQDLTSQNNQPSTSADNTDSIITVEVLGYGGPDIN